jgi:uncharacterized membrane protein YbhN (UPF0104 family)
LLSNRYWRRDSLPADGRFRATIDTELVFHRFSLRPGVPGQRVVEAAASVVKVNCASADEDHVDRAIRHFLFRVTEMSKFVRGLEWIDRVRCLRRRRMGLGGLDRRGGHQRGKPSRYRETANTVKAKHWSIIARVVFAAGGIAYICWMVNWTDRVQLPAGAVLASGQRLAEATWFPARAIAEGENGGQTRFELRVRGSDGQETPLVVTVDPSETAAEAPQFQPGIVTTLREAQGRWLILGLLIISVTFPIQTVRWSLLMRYRGLEVTLWKSFRLLMVGCFFNYCMPGTTGGDVVRAYYAARHSDRRADAVMSIIVDRICGLLGLVVLAGVMGLLMREEPLARSITKYIGASSVLIVSAAGIYFSPRLRRRLGFDWFLGLLPAKGFVASVDGALVAYRHHLVVILVAVLLSLCVHSAASLSAAMAGYALGMQVPIGLLLVVLPVVYFVGAIPISPQGIGVMEAVAMTMLLDPPATQANQILGMLLLMRLFQITYSMTGSLFLLKGDIHLHPEAYESSKG